MSQFAFTRFLSLSLLKEEKEEKEKDDKTELSSYVEEVNWVKMGVPPEATLMIITNA